MIENVSNLLPLSCTIVSEVGLGAECFP